MALMTRFFAPALLAISLGIVSLAAPTIAKAQSGNDLARVLVNVADVIYRSGTPYYRHGNYGYNDRLIVVRDRYDRRTYYRHVPRHVTYRYAPPRVVYRTPVRTYRHYDNRRANCNRHGKCKVTYYYSSGRDDRRHDRRHRKHDKHDRRHDRDRWEANGRGGRGH